VRYGRGGSHVVEDIDVSGGGFHIRLRWDHDAQRSVAAPPTAVASTANVRIGSRFGGAALR
jgi:hypothetical protein